MVQFINLWNNILKTSCQSWQGYCIWMVYHYFQAFTVRWWTTIEPRTNVKVCIEPHNWTNEMRGCRLKVLSKCLIFGKSIRIRWQVLNYLEYFTVIEHGCIEVESITWTIINIKDKRGFCNKVWANIRFKRKAKKTKSDHFLNIHKLELSFYNTVVTMWITVPLVDVLQQACSQRWGHCRPC